MGDFIAQKIITWLRANQPKNKIPKIGILGLTFNENIRDLRNSRVPDIIAALNTAGLQAHIHDPMVDGEQARHEYGLTLCSKDDLNNLDVLVLAVAHKQFIEHWPDYAAFLREDGFLVDIKSCLNPAAQNKAYHYWSL
jgi:UDP-N-acetyl-D-galactosamine dehydrogenase